MISKTCNPSGNSRYAHARFGGFLMLQLKRNHQPYDFTEMALITSKQPGTPIHGKAGKLHYSGSKACDFHENRSH